MQYNNQATVNLGNGRRIDIIIPADITNEEKNRLRKLIELLIYNSDGAKMEKPKEFKLQSHPIGDSNEQE